jgi:hypothetical protein
MADFWGKLGNAIPKKGYSKYGKSIDRKLKPKRRKHKPAPRKPVATKNKQKSNIRFPGERDAKWRPYLTFTSREKAFSMAKHLKETDGYPTRVDGIAGGYQVWIKS